MDQAALALGLGLATEVANVDLERVGGAVSAVATGDVAALAERLDANPQLIDALAGRGLQKATPLALAALRNRHGAARLLIARGADLNKRDFPDNAAPLHFAAALVTSAS